MYDTVSLNQIKLILKKISRKKIASYKKINTVSLISQNVHIFVLLSLRYETEVVKLRKQKDGEITKLRSNLRKCQNELTEAIHCLANSAQHHGLSGAGNETHVFTSILN